MALPAAFRPAALRAALTRRLGRARPPEALPIRLRQRRIYVLPTPAGLAFAGALPVLLVASINYELSLGFALTFLLASIGLVSMVHAFRNLLHLTIHPGRCEPVFCGEPAHFALQLENDRTGERPALQLTAGTNRARIDLPPRDTVTAVLALPTSRRGWMRLGRIIVETRYPLGLVRAWSVLTPDLRCLVYPAPEADPPPLPTGGDRSAGLRRQCRGDDDFAGLREHQRADSPRHIAWKTVARGGPLLTKQFAGGTASDIVLDWAALPAGMDDEARLARLCAWLLTAHASGQPFALHLGATRLPRGSGSRHLHEALALLALHGSTDDAR
jgi:uncharacterized protein (DUF58 family)